MQQLMQPLSGKVSSRDAMRESMRIRMEYERRRRREEAKKKEDDQAKAYQDEQEEASREGGEEDKDKDAVFEMPGRKLQGRTWQERAENLAQGVFGAVHEMESTLAGKVQPDSMDSVDNVGRGSSPVEGMDPEGTSGGRQVQGFPHESQVSPEWEHGDSGPGETRRGVGGPDKTDEPVNTEPLGRGAEYGEQAEAPDVVVAEGPNEYMQVREGMGNSTYEGHLLKGVRLAVRGAKEVPGKGWNLELCQACDLVGENCPASADPYLTNKPFKFKNGKEGVSHRQLYTYEEYGAMQAVANKQGDCMVFYGDLLPRKGKDGSVSFVVDTDYLRASQTPFDLKAHGTHVGAAKVALAAKGLEADPAVAAMGGEPLGQAPEPEKGAAAPKKPLPKPEGLLEPDEAPGAGELDEEPVWDLSLKPKKRPSEPVKPSDVPPLPEDLLPPEPDGMDFGAELESLGVPDGFDISGM